MLKRPNRRIGIYAVGRLELLSLLCVYGGGGKVAFMDLCHGSVVGVSTMATLRRVYMALL